MIGMIISAVTTVAKALAVTTLAIDALKMIGNALMGIGKALGLIKSETEVEELGDKALQAEEEGIRPENYDTYTDYVRAIENFELDPEKSKALDPEKKIKKGIEVTSGVTAEKYPETLDLFEYALENPAYFTGDRMKEIGKLLASEGGSCIESILKYMNGSEKNVQKLDSTVQMLLGVEKRANPGISDRDALAHVFKARK